MLPLSRRTQLSEVSTDRSMLIIMSVAYCLPSKSSGTGLSKCFCKWHVLLDGTCDDSEEQIFECPFAICCKALVGELTKFISYPRKLSKEKAENELNGTNSQTSSARCSSERTLYTQMPPPYNAPASETNSFRSRSARSQRIDKSLGMARMVIAQLNFIKCQ